mmetsp:Transcript_18372/g.36578  ORF Transcript_18372/g.36578 Transcript_18372/m.36578 type:complete len:158 (+) Transcript_18372:353-826(+)
MYYGADQRGETRRSRARLRSIHGVAVVQTACWSRVLSLYSQQRRRMRTTAIILEGKRRTLSPLQEDSSSSSDSSSGIKINESSQEFLRNLNGFFSSCNDVKAKARQCLPQDFMSRVDSFTHKDMVDQQRLGDPLPLPESTTIFWQRRRGACCSWMAS